MRMGERVIGAAGLVFVSSLSWVSIAASGAGGDPVAARLIGALNTQVQERFKDTDKGFGIARMVPMETDESGRLRVARHRLGRSIGPRSPAPFQAENVHEMAAIQDLEQAGLRDPEMDPDHP